MSTILSNLLREKSIGHPREAEAHEMADKFDVATAGWSADPPTISPQSFLGAWARARRLYCEITGEPLI